MSRIVWIDGIMGAGKTTFARELAQRLGFRCVEEDTSPYLSQYYSVPGMWAFPFQLDSAVRRFGAHKEALREHARDQIKGAVLDRALPGDRAMAELHRAAGNVTDAEWDIYQRLYRTLIAQLPKPRVLVYLEVKTATALERIRKRGRESEANVDADYLDRMRERYQAMAHALAEQDSPWHGTAIFAIGASAPRERLHSQVATALGIKLQQEREPARGPKPNTTDGSVLVKDSWTAPPSEYVLVKGSNGNGSNGNGKTKAWARPAPKEDLGLLRQSYLHQLQRDPPHRLSCQCHDCVELKQRLSRVGLWGELQREIELGRSARI